MIQYCSRSCFLDFPNFCLNPCLEFTKEPHLDYRALLIEVLAALIHAINA